MEKNILNKTSKDKKPKQKLKPYKKTTKNKNYLKYTDYEY